MISSEVHKKYIQKSQIFLYPALTIPRGAAHVPIGTYVAWKGLYVPEDRKLICLYALSSSPEFKSLEKQKLIGNKLFHDLKEIEEGKVAYIFDFTTHKNDYDLFIEGKYSQMSESYKKMVKRFYNNNINDFRIVESFLTPNKYYWIYNKILNVDIEHLKEAGELCSKPDLEKEELVTEIKSLEFTPEFP